MTRPLVCVVGSANIDLIFRSARLPRPGETFAGKAFQLCHGGKGANQAVTAARLGAQVTLVARLGRDVFGEQALQNFQEQGLDTSYIARDPDRPTGVASITVDDGANNCIIVVAGANQALSPADVRGAAEAIRQSAILICQLETPLDATLEAFRLARASAVRTILNPAPAAPLPDELLQLTDLLVPNEPELQLLSGREVKNAAQAEKAARVLLVRGPKTIVATLGGSGVLMVDEKATKHFPAVPVQAVDTTGAGDAFIGSLAVGLAEGRSLPEAVRRANAVAALSVTRAGTQTSFPTRLEAEAFWKELS